jgi:hypothetical protein
MLNSKGIRELAYVVRINEVRDIEGVNNQVAVVNGWTVFVKRDEFKAGDLAVYFEIDSKVPEIECFEFLRKYNFKVKTQKFVKGLVISQGLVIKPEELGLKNVKEGDFLTEKLGVIYYDPEDNKRKSNISGKYMSMRARHPKLAQTKLFKWLWKREWGKKLLFFFLGRKKDKPNDWPSWVVKTDEERCQNCFSAMKALNRSWIVTEKIDGSSTTFTMKQAPAKKRELIVCSRNVVFNAPEKEDKNFYKDTDGNIYLEMAERYGMKDFLNRILNCHKNWEFITIQGETFGGSIQKRKYGNDHKLAVFNVIYKENGKAPIRMNPYEMLDFINEFNKRDDFRHVKCVPIIAEITLPETCEELLAMAGGESYIDGGMREGIVLRTSDGVHSFKAVDNEFLLKYHNG